MNKRIKLLLYAAIIIAALAGLAALRNYLAEADEAKESEVRSSRQYAPAAPEDHPALLWYREYAPDKEILLACNADITADGAEDMVLIYRIEKGAAEAVALIAQPDGSYFVTPPTPAPQQHQKMRFINIDHDPELEFLMTGDKDGVVGYAVFRIQDNAIVDLFGEGMEDCC